METINALRNRITADQQNSFRYRGYLGLKICGALFMITAAAILLGLTPVFSGNAPLTYLFSGGFASVGLALVCGKTFLPRDISIGSGIEFYYGALVSTCCLLALLLIGTVLLDYIANGPVINLILVILALVPLTIIFRMKGENIKNSILALCTGTFLISFYLYFFMGLALLYGDVNEYLAFLPMSFALCYISFGCWSREEELSTYVAYRHTRVANDRMLARSYILFFTASIVICVPMLASFIDCVNPELWNGISQTAVSSVEYGFIVSVVDNLYLAEITGFLIGFMVGLRKAWHAPVVSRDYANMIRYTAMGLVGAFIICASIPLVILYGLTYLVALFMSLAILYVILVM